ncbi:hypothetical protein ABDK56_01500 [Sphingomonas sp. ASV193]|uniref:hypothetical protein n=1 Tax=Sphingomonas sp. ASV193 TaxID=3144405 RepID=UPI0032E8F2CD
MQRAASEVMQGILFSALVDAIAAAKAAAGGVPNVMLRDLQSLHPNTAFADLPRPLQDSIRESVRSAFAQLLKDGYVVGPKGTVQTSRPLDRVPERERRDPGDRRDNRRTPGRRGPGTPGPRGPRPGGGGPRGGGGGAKPKP